ncbi:MAG: acetyl-CoA carboxylase biotin carboxyl carrier protein subunit [Bacteroidales bacterium]|nr:acetyl-CoA carboxylase biotin carboxyl carrier protein subunit [Bacteroidales bacterium]
MKKFKFSIQGNPYSVEVKDFEENIATVEVNGTFYQVELEKQMIPQKTPTLIRKPLKPSKNAGAISKASGATLVMAPLPGNIMQVVKKTDDVVKKGDFILMYEAMKMENKLMAEKDGIIGKVHVTPGDAVLQGDVLFEIL